MQSYLSRKTSRYAEARTYGIGRATPWISPRLCSRKVRAHDTPNSPDAGPLVKEANDLSGNVLASCLLVVHDTSRRGEHDVSELTGRQQLDNPLLEIGEADVVARR